MLELRQTQKVEAGEEVGLGCLRRRPSLETFVPYLLDKVGVGCFTFSLLELSEFPKRLTSNMFTILTTLKPTGTEPHGENKFAEGALIKIQSVPGPTIPAHEIQVAKRKPHERDNGEEDAGARCGVSITIKRRVPLATLPFRIIGEVVACTNLMTLSCTVILP
ncbi:uncharacterized protein BcabD6B2_10350 [Babesia caballi]|uniref:Uncharacterized protein n=1 Tax=Babesia caballi TaxID=5871 RepID=A0AAV4LNT4_BABCB|nr:hypothetical protein, conserved [Babesia caballi]